jgi:lysophospholipase L1-like esterase
MLAYSGGVLWCGDSNVVRLFDDRNGLLRRECHPPGLANVSSACSGWNSTQLRESLSTLNTDMQGISVVICIGTNEIRTSQRSHPLILTTYKRNIFFLLRLFQRLKCPHVMILSPTPFSFPFWPSLHNQFRFFLKSLQHEHKLRSFLAPLALSLPMQMTYIDTWSCFTRRSLSKLGRDRMVVEDMLIDKYAYGPSKGKVDGIHWSQKGKAAVVQMVKEAHAAYYIERLDAHKNEIYF